MLAFSDGQQALLLALGRKLGASSQWFENKHVLEGIKKEDLFEMDEAIVNFKILANHQVSEAFGVGRIDPAKEPGFPLYHFFPREVKVVIYARVSTRDKGQDPENQVHQLRAFAEQHGTIYKVFTEEVSGSKSDRSEFK
jgi:hypothetical protein